MTSALRNAGIVAAVLSSTLAAAGGDSPDLLMLLTTTGVVDERERSKVDAGGAVFVVLPGRGRDLAVFGITRTTAPSGRLAAWTRAVEQLYRGRYVPDIGRFSDSPQLADVAGLMLDDEDLTDLRRCRPGDCAVKLSASEMQEITAAATTAGADWKPAVQLAFRKVVVGRARSYLQGGFAAVVSYDDRKAPVSPALEFDTIAAQVGFEPLYGSRVLPYLRAYPDVDGREVESFLYWSKERLGAGKPIVTITHVALFRDPPPGAGVVVAARQVFASHYLTGSLSLTLIAGGVDDAPAYLVYLRRSRTDAFAGAFGSIIRRLVEGRIRSDAPAVLDALRRTLEGGEPRDADFSG